MDLVVPVVLVNGRWPLHTYRLRYTQVPTYYER